MENGETRLGSFRDHQVFHAAQGGVVRATLLRRWIAQVGNGSVLFQKPGGATVMTESGVVEMVNRMSDAEWIEQLSRCCSSTVWCDAVARRRPFADRTHLN